MTPIHKKKTVKNWKKKIQTNKAKFKSRQKKGSMDLLTERIPGGDLHFHGSLSLNLSLSGSFAAISRDFGGQTKVVACFVVRTSWSSVGSVDQSSSRLNRPVYMNRTRGRFGSIFLEILHIAPCKI